MPFTAMSFDSKVSRKHADWIDDDSVADAMPLPV